MPKLPDLVVNIGNNLHDERETLPPHHLVARLQVLQQRLTEQWAPIELDSVAPTHNQGLEIVRSAESMKQMFKSSCARFSLAGHTSRVGIPMVQLRACAGSVGSSMISITV